jgi:hypothetical protein
MTPRSRRLLLLALPISLTLPFAIVWLLWPRTAITRENAASIQPGMTLADVEMALGGPPRDESTGDLAAEEDATIEHPDERYFQAKMLAAIFRRDGPPDPQCTRVWVSDQVIIRVYIDETSRVYHATVLPVRRILENPLDLLRRCLRL